MALRQFRKKMKAITVVITAAFVLSSLALYIMNHQNYSSVKNHALKINGEKISQEEVARIRYNLSNNINLELDEETLKVLVLDQAIETELTEQLADDLKIKISSKDVNAEYEKVEKNFQDKEQLARMLMAQGYTKASFKKEIEKRMKSMKAMEVLEESVKVSDEEAKIYFDENKATLFANAKFEDVKEEIKKYTTQEKLNEVYKTRIHELKSQMKLEDVSEEYKSAVEKPEIEKDGIEFTNVDFAKTYVNLLAGGMEAEKAKEETAKALNNQVAMINAAKAKGIEVDTTKPLTLELKKAYESLTKKLKSEVVVTEENLKNYFEANREKYNIYPSVDAYIAKLKIEASEEDKALTTAKAVEILKTLTVENFAETAKEKSACPSSAKGGDLGWFGKNQMVKEFEEAAFTGEVGKIYPEIVNTVFGSHIIYVAEKNEKEEKVKASHILLTFEISEATKKAAMEAAKKEVVEKLSKDEIKFEDLDFSKYQGSKLYTNITAEGYIQDMGYIKPLSDEVYGSGLNKVELKEIDGEVYLFEKVKEIKAREVSLEEVKDRVQEDYKMVETYKSLEDILSK